MGIINAQLNVVTARSRFQPGSKVLFGQPGEVPDPENPATLKVPFIDKELVLPANPVQGIDSDSKFEQSSDGNLYGTGQYSIRLIDRAGNTVYYLPSVDVTPIAEGDFGTAAYADIATPAEALAGTAGVLPDAEQVRKNHVAQVATIGDLRNLNPSFDGQEFAVSSYLDLAAPRMPLGGGIFVAKLGDFSAEVAGDPKSCDYVSFQLDLAGTPGLTGAFVRQREGVVTPEMCGADPYSGTDVTAEVKYSLTRSKQVDFLPATYRMSDRLITNGHQLRGKFSETFDAGEKTEILFSNMPAVDSCIVNETTASNYYGISFRHDTWTGATPRIHGIHIKRTVYAERCAFSSFPGFGGYAYGLGGAEFSPYNSVFQSCTFDYNKEHGFAVANGANLMNFRDCFARWNGAPSYNTAPSVAGSYDGIYVDGQMGEFPVGLTFEPQGVIIQGGDISYNSRYGVNWRRCTDCLQLGGYMEVNVSGDEINIADTFSLVVVNPLTLGSIRTTDFVQTDPITPSRNARAYPNRIIVRGSDFGEGSLNSVSGKPNVYFNKAFYTANGRNFGSDSVGNNFGFWSSIANSRLTLDTNTRLQLIKFYMGGSFASDSDNAFFSPDGNIQGNVFFNLINQGPYSTFYNVSGAAGNAADTHVRLATHSSTGRSINAGGTINASGADYAEYEHNNGIVFKKGDIVGFKIDGTLTNVFSEAVRFAVKSTSPAYVGGDVWGSEENLGARPEKPEYPSLDNLSKHESEEALKKYSVELDEYTQKCFLFESRLEEARLLVDRVAYSGKVPVNVYNTMPGEYIIAMEGESGFISSYATSEPSFSEYLKCVGRVNRLLDDGRAEIAVIIH